MLLPVLAVGLLPGPVLLGLWDSLTYYHSFGAVDAPLSFLIAPRANIAGQGYAALEVARPIIAFFDLPVSVSTFRIPALAFGLLSLLLFFTICRRYFGAWPALGATALLGANPVFFQAEHTMTVLVVSGAALLFLVERLQALEARYWDLKTWLGAGLAMALVALHYGVARIFAVILIALWFAKAYWILRATPGSAAIRRGVLVLAGCAAAIFLLVLALLDPRNLLSIARFPYFLFPEHSDIAVLQYAPGAAGVSGLAGMLEINLQILAESVLGRTGEFHSRHASYLLADMRYPLLEWFVVPFALLGLIVAAARMRRRTVMLATPWGNVLVMLAVFALPILLSLVIATPEGSLATLSVHRMYFCLFPLHLLVAAFLAGLAESGLHKVAKYAAALCVTATFAGLLFNLIGEQARFSAQVYAAPWQKHGQDAMAYWDDGMPNRDRRQRLFVSHLQQHAQYANVAKEVARKLAAATGPENQNARRIIYVDAIRFSESPIAPAALQYITNRNFHAVFLALYAGGEGLRINPLVMVDASRRPVRPDLMAGLAYKGMPREYSALTELDRNGRLTYQSGRDLVPVIIDLAGDPTRDILVTTPEEEAGARALLEKQGTLFLLVRI